MNRTYNVGVFGCGDFFRIQKKNLLAASQVKIKWLFDADLSRAQANAAELGVKVAETAEQIIGDPEVDIVAIFVPPWVRKDLMLMAAAAGKHVITTKPLGNTLAECDEMIRAFQNGPRVGVIYNRTGNSLVKTLKSLFEGGEVGRLGLYKQDWYHHYPQWNNWALDPKKNGGPFMDAMIHCMNIARHLVGSEASSCTLFSSNHAHPELTCNDTEFLKLDFKNGASAHLFISWAADLEVMNPKANQREHIDILKMITDKGWFVTVEIVDQKRVVCASRDGEKKMFPVYPGLQNLYDRFAHAIDSDDPIPDDLASLEDAYEDIRIITKAMISPGVATPLL